MKYQNFLSVGILSLFLFAGTFSVSKADATSTCINLSKYLYYGINDSQVSGEVSKLQSFLKSKGYLNDEVTGYFGKATLSSVKSFQNDNQIETVGMVGPKTRKSISSSDCNMEVVNTDQQQGDQALNNDAVSNSGNNQPTKPSSKRVIVQKSNSTSTELSMATSTIAMYASSTEQLSTTTESIASSSEVVSDNAESGSYKRGPKMNGLLWVPILKTGSGYSPYSQLVVGGVTAKIADYYFVVSDKDAYITEMTFGINVSTFGGYGIRSVTVGGVTAPVVNNSATITGLNIHIPVSYVGTIIPVSVEYSNVGLAGVPSGQEISLEITGYKYTFGYNPVSVSGVSIPSNTMVLVASKPTVTLANASDSVVGTGGSVEIARVTVSADAAGPISVEELPLRISTSGLAEVINATTVKVNGVTVTTTGGITSVGTSTNADGIIVFTNGYDIAAGTPITFSIWGDVTLTDTTDSIRTGIPNSSLFKWNDIEGNLTLTGEKIYNFPINSALISY